MKEPRMFDDLESALGGLSPVQRILLGTDGSVTSLLELVTGSPVSVTTLTQEIQRADEHTAAALHIRSGEEINHRIVELKNSETGEVLIYAVSDTPLSRLSPEFREDLMRADIPIGRILSKYKMESRREIMEMKLSKSDAPMSERFGLCADLPFLSRKYRIIHQNKPLICIKESFPSHCFREGKRILVDAPSRLHLGLIDLNGALGRVDGGMGIALRNPRILLSAEYSEETIVEGNSEEIRKRVAYAADLVAGALNLPGKARIKILEGYPQHIGLGSGTQYALAVGRALCELYGADPDLEKLAMIAGRGGTSGIGTAAFAGGGFLIDAGHRFGPSMEKHSFLPSSAVKGVRPAPVISRHHFPEHWKILVIMPSLPGGASGIAEKDIFQKYCPIPLDEVQALCHEILMRLLPGLVEEDLDMFGTAINRVQTLGFKKIELELQPSEINTMIEDLRNSGAAAAGLSSFGPVVYAISDGNMRDLETVARDSLSAMGGGDWCVTSARNKGASVITA
ncbi:MAG TPA: beta-ribofuranosylaminobenzene 5'-phosphate synthase [Methanoregulaceae archaeon]|nr:beta-ribofuranosylaminobenzene 5'-phosphate synthase [Methanoregulaceae archaeon]